ncbi:MAG: HD domain-containing protein [Candidatus Rokubacteria bacterium]|nr:HD domain-containing protein [Candidatus Rokubacteria bacterium]
MADRLLDALAHAAARQYGGEPVSELAHSLQCGDLAREAGADEELVLACLLHDVGRYAVDQARVSDSQDRADAAAPGARGHHAMGAQLIGPYVPARVAWLVGMHADAKRYLCATEPGYYDRLTPASQHTLTLQGGVMGADEIARLAAHRWLGDALRLRRWDDQAKVLGKTTRPLSAWEPLLRKYFTHSRSDAAGRHGDSA